MCLGAEVLDKLTDASVFGEEQRSVLVIGCSGGMDSSVLADIVLKPEILASFRRVVVAHVNYGLRGAESDEDEAFVVDLASRYGVESIVHRVAKAGQPGTGVQKWARDVRYQFFRSILTGGGLLCLGHHADDLAESVIFRLTRGSNWGNWTGMSECAAGVYRPLLRFGRSEIREYCHRHKLPYREDSSNAKLDYSRNKIRHKVVPVLEEIQPKASEKIIETFRSIEEVVGWWEESLRAKIREDGFLSTEVLKGLPDRLLPISLYQLVSLIGCGRFTVPEAVMTGAMAAWKNGEQRKTWSLPGGGMLDLSLLGFRVSSEVAKEVRYAQNRRTLLRPGFEAVVMAYSEVFVAEFGFGLRNSSGAFLRVFVSPLESYKTIMYGCGNRLNVKEIVSCEVGGHYEPLNYCVVSLNDESDMIADLVSGRWLIFAGFEGPQDWPLEILFGL